MSRDIRTPAPRPNECPNGHTDGYRYDDSYCGICGAELVPMRPPKVIKIRKGDVCSKCGKTFPHDHRIKFCPGCGREVEWYCCQR